MENHSVINPRVPFYKWTHPMFDTYLRQWLKAYRERVQGENSEVEIVEDLLSQAIYPCMASGQIKVPPIWVNHSQFRFKVNNFFSALAWFVKFTEIDLNVVRASSNTPGFRPTQFASDIAGNFADLCARLAKLWFKGDHSGASRVEVLWEPSATDDRRFSTFFIHLHKEKKHKRRAERDPEGASDARDLCRHSRKLASFHEQFNVKLRCWACEIPWDESTPLEDPVFFSWEKCNLCNVGQPNGDDLSDA
ncbi:hypothetical protein K474DRAFT_1710033 [Panus rudis PR-1116 ss-1]|nr:hypothetical protein K474DRAFT_1710033 [Panus rudis PR-1116 ss-1]